MYIERFSCWFFFGFFAYYSSVTTLLAHHKNETDSISKNLDLGVSLNELSTTVNSFAFSLNNPMTNQTRKNVKILKRYDLPNAQNQFLSKFTTSTSVAAISPISLPAYGTCKKDKVYTIQSMNDLYSNVKDLECIFSSAIVPDKIPLGALYGRILAVANTKFYNPLIQNFYQGDYVVETKCNGKTYNLISLKFSGLTISTGLMYIGKITKAVSKNEYYDGKEGLIMDFSVNMNEICNIEIDSLNPFKYFNFKPFKSEFNSNIYPIKLFIDQLRVVGRDTDNCLLYLGRTFMQNPSTNDPLVTSWYFCLKSCDPEVNISFKRGDSLPPIEKDFNYLRTSALTLINRGSPFNYLYSLL